MDETTLQAESRGLRNGIRKVSLHEASLVPSGVRHKIEHRHLRSKWTPLGVQLNAPGLLFQLVLTRKEIERPNEGGLAMKMLKGHALSVLQVSSCKILWWLAHSVKAADFMQAA